MEVRKNFSAEKKTDKAIIGLMLLLMLHWDRASLSSAGTGFPPLAHCWSQLGRDSENMVLLDAEWDKQGCRQGAMGSLQLSQWDSRDGT